MKKILIGFIVIVVLIAAVTFAVYLCDVNRDGKDTANQRWSEYLGDFGFRLLHPIEYRKEQEAKFNVTVPGV